MRYQPTKPHVLHMLCNSYSCNGIFGHTQSALSISFSIIFVKSSNEVCVKCKFITRELSTQNVLVYSSYISLFDIRVNITFPIENTLNIGGFLEVSQISSTFASDNKLRVELYLYADTVACGTARLTVPSRRARVEGSPHIHKRSKP